MAVWYHLQNQRFHLFLKSAVLLPYKDSVPSRYLWTDGITVRTLWKFYESHKRRSMCKDFIGDSLFVSILLETFKKFRQLDWVLSKKFTGVEFSKNTPNLL